MTEKERILQIVGQLPDTATLDDVMHELYIRRIVDRGLADLDAGRAVNHEDARKRLGKWLER